jgi:LPS export ABC transporter protein LptC
MLGRRKSMSPKGVSLILASFLLFSLSGCQQEEPARTAGDSFADMPEQVIENMEVTFTESGRRTGILRADSVAIYQGGRIKEGRRVQVDFYDRQGEHISVLTALEGSYDSEAEEVHARGDVVVVSDDGARLETDELSWKKETNRITTQAHVTITRGQDEVSGYGLSTDPQLEDFHILRDVRGRIEDVREITE